MNVARLEEKLEGGRVFKSLIVQLDAMEVALGPRQSPSK